MKSRHHSETRSEVIFRHTTKMLHETRCSWEAFAQRVVEHYHEAVPLAAREIQFKTEGDIFHCAKINAQKLSRYADDRINARMPVDLEESWIAGLTDAYRAECLHDLARRYGLLAVPIPAAARAAPAADAMKSMSAVSREFGQAFEAIAPIIANGSFGPEDAPFIEVAERELEDLLAAVTSLLDQVRAVKEGSRP